MNLIGMEELYLNIQKILELPIKAKTEIEFKKELKTLEKNYQKLLKMYIKKNSSSRKTTRTN